MRGAAPEHQWRGLLLAGLEKAGSRVLLPAGKIPVKVTSRF